MNTVKFYLKNNKQSILNKEEEKELIKLAEKGNLEARNKLVLGNLKFAVHYTKKIRTSKRLGREDVLEECICGLIKAANHVNSEYDNLFITYANLWCKSSIDNAINSSGGGMRLPEYKFRTMKKVRTVYEKFIEEGSNKDDSVNKTAAELELSEEAVIHNLKISKPELSLENMIDNAEQDNKSYEEFLSDGQDLEDNVVKNDSEKFIRNIILKLPFKEADVLYKHYGLNNSTPMTLSEIGMLYNLSKQSIADIEKKAKLHLVKFYEDELKEVL